MAESTALGRKAKRATTLLVLVGVVYAIAAMSDIAALANGSAMDAPQATIGMVQTVVVVVAGVAFLLWWHQAFVNATALDPEAVEKLSPRWAVGAWFVPLLNLVFPYQIAKRMWWAVSQQKSPRPDVPAYLPQWWGCFIASGFLSRAAGRVDSSELQNLLFLGSDLLGAIATTQGIRVIEGLSPVQATLQIDESPSAVYEGGLTRS